MDWPYFVENRRFLKCDLLLTCSSHFAANRFFWSETVRLRKADMQVHALRSIQFHEGAIVSQPLHLPIKVDQHAIPFA